MCFVIATLSSGISAGLFLKCCVFRIRGLNWFRLAVSLTSRDDRRLCCQVGRSAPADCRPCLQLDDRTVAILSFCEIMNAYLLLNRNIVYEGSVVSN